MRIPAAFRAAIFILLASGIGFPRAVTAKDKKPVDKAAVNAAITKANQYYARKDFAHAIDAYNNADKLSQHNCPDCLLAIYQIYKRVGGLDYALDETKKALKEAGDDKIAAARAHEYHGVLLAAMAGHKPTDKKLAQAVEDLRASIALNPPDAMAHFNLGVLLMRQEQDAAGAAELKTYLASPSRDAAHSRKAEMYIANPLYAREPIAPDFSFTTLEGAQISLEALKGKVTLLDFWGTWCPPCRESIPTLLALRKKFAAKPVEFVGISSDSDENAWKTFVAARHMDWPEYIDLSNTVQETFEIDSFPTYIVIDAQGMIRFRQSGFGEQATAAELEDAINRALKEKPPKEKQSSESGMNPGSELRAVSGARMNLAPMQAHFVAASLHENLQQQGSETGAAQNPQQNDGLIPPAPVLVQGNLAEGRLVHSVMPVYPEDARRAHVSGTVVLHAIIAADGTIKQLTYRSGPALLKDAAMHAVEQWQYQPYMLNGRPVPVDTTISVIFNLSKGPGGSAADQSGGTQNPASAAAAGASAAANAAAMDPQLKANIVKLLDLTHAMALGHDAAARMLQSLRPTLIAALPPTEHREQIADAYGDKLTSLLTGQTMTDQLAGIYARHLSADDVAAMIQFYQTPAGQHSLAALPQIMAESQQLGSNVAQENLPRILHELCTEFPELRGKVKFCPAGTQNESSEWRDNFGSELRGQIVGPQPRLLKVSWHSTPVRERLEKQQPGSAAQAKPQQTPTADAGLDEHVSLNDGTKITGKIVAIDGDIFHIETSFGKIDVPRAKITSVIFGTAAEPQPSPQAAISQSISGTRYTNGTGHFTMTVPTGWTANDDEARKIQNGIGELSSTDPHARIVMQFLPPGAPAKETSQVLESALKNTFDGYEEVGEGPLEIDGHDSYSVTFRALIATGNVKTQEGTNEPASTTVKVAVKYLLTIIPMKEHTVMIMSAAPEAVYGKFEPVFQQIVRSFHSQN